MNENAGRRCFARAVAFVSFAKTLTGDMMSDVARDSSGEGSSALVVASA